ncbi:hypothetical protein Cgig2_019273 [Carnegiea gigantea]|uniref:Uncharacterized protein n=1 Tax=Carnegiea gigantea TaxID=171969 RepID=A0A9Q1KNV9_9CARY|nr:hypothetical protein Cgig2_019273 [Carnegiea gigantea]
MCVVWLRGGDEVNARAGVEGEVEQRLERWLAEKERVEGSGEEKRLWSAAEVSNSGRVESARGPTQKQKPPRSKEGHGQGYVIKRASTTVSDVGYPGLANGAAKGSEVRENEAAPVIGSTMMKGAPLRQGEGHGDNLASNPIFITWTAEVSREQWGSAQDGVAIERTPMT